MALAEAKAKKLTLRIGNINFYHIDSAIRADSSSGIVGAILGFEKDLGLGTAINTLHLDADYYFNHKHCMNINYSQFRRVNSVVLNDEINFRDESFVVDRLLTTNYKSTLIEVSYMYTLFENSNIKYSIGTGLNANFLNVTLQSVLNSEDDDDENTHENAKGEIYLPILIFSGQLNFSPKLNLKAVSKIKNFLFEVDNVIGVFHDMEIGLDYKITPRYKIGLSLGQANTDIEVNDDELRSSYEYTSNKFFSYMAIDF